MTTSTHSVDTFADALWGDVRKELAKAIIGTIRTMGLPTPGRGKGHRHKESRGRTPGTRAVRFALMADIDLHCEIVDQVEVQFRQAVARGAIVSSADRGLVFRIAQCLTWKHATRRARELFRTVIISEAFGDDESLVCPEPLPEEIFQQEEMRDRLGRALAGLDPADRRLLLEGKAEGRYGELAEEFGVKAGTLRVRAHRLWTLVSAEVIGSEETA